MDGRAGRFAVMGVSGVGKTRVGLAVAEALGARFVEGDDLHPEANRVKMAGGTPLSDEDRWPWLDRVAEALAEGAPPVVGACSALRRRYRDRLRDGAPGLVMVHLVGAPELIGERLRARTGHFMPPALLRSQIETLEPLGADEAGFAVPVERPVEDVVAEILAGIARL
jgi:carbohydrate kinase (thermoresistant glucokinase family)